MMKEISCTTIYEAKIDNKTYILSVTRTSKGIKEAYWIDRIPVIKGKIIDARDYFDRNPVLL